MNCWHMLIWGTLMWKTVLTKFTFGWHDSLMNRWILSCSIISKSELFRTTNTFVDFWNQIFEIQSFSFSHHNCKYIVFLQYGSSHASFVTYTKFEWLGSSMNCWHMLIWGTLMWKTVLTKFTFGWHDSLMNRWILSCSIISKSELFRTTNTFVDFWNQIFEIQSLNLRGFLSWNFLTVIASIWFFSSMGPVYFSFYQCTYKKRRFNILETLK